jgi:hypothetical protein
MLKHVGRGFVGSHFWRFSLLDGIPSGILNTFFWKFGVVDFLKRVPDSSSHRNLEGTTL